MQMILARGIVVFLIVGVLRDVGASNLRSHDQVIRTGSDGPDEVNVQASSKSSSISAQSLDMTSAAMEAAIADLMLGKTSFGATPMGGSVKKIKNLITKDMMPKVLAAHKIDQEELRRLIAEIKKCGSTKQSALRGANGEITKYKKASRLHKRCRSDEAVKYTSMSNCLRVQRRKYQVKRMRCKIFSDLSVQLGTQKNNRAIVTKAGGETSDSYLIRISTTICGRHVHGSRGRSSRTGGWGGGLANGMLDRYLQAKYRCRKATADYNKQVKECRRKTHAYGVRKAQCNQHQKLMDAASCKGAVMTKDTCESYAGCYFANTKAYRTSERQVSLMERDRKAEWRGLKRMSCIIDAFADGKVTNEEVDTCKKRKAETKHLKIKYPKVPPLQKCSVPNLYPSTGAYKRAEFAPLPMLAKGNPSPECSGVKEIATRPRRGSPKSCKCRRVSLVGPYSAGAMVKCSKCLDVRRSRERTSCPRGTKIFSPRNRADWKTFLNSAGPVRSPHWIIDITRPSNGCGGCTRYPMKSTTKQQAGWKTFDGSAWWLRSSRYSEPNGDYSANCFLNLNSNFHNENAITFNDNRCNYHSKSYYCQPRYADMKPRAGSPASCKCSSIDLSGSYSAGALVKCEQCITVYRSSQKSSCPVGMKIFSPRSAGDWKTVIDSVGPPLRAPHWIIDVTRPQNGCGGCTRYPMKSTAPQQATWKTSDASAWWLRNSRYNEPNGDYSANCFMDLWRIPSSAHNIQFNDGRCNYRSRSYYCQPSVPKPKPKPRPPAPRPKPPVISMSLQGAKNACSRFGPTWKTKWTSPKSIVCTKGGISYGHNCNHCNTWRMMAFANGGGDMSPGGGGYSTSAGYYYCGHRPCRSSRTNLPYGGSWNPNPINKALAIAYCKKIGWKVKWTSSRSLICTTVSAGSNCNKCNTWRLLVWENGGTDMSSGGQVYRTSAGHMYAGHKPCRSGWNLPHCGSWAR